MLATRVSQSTKETVLPIASVVGAATALAPYVIANVIPHVRHPRTDVEQAEHEISAYFLGLGHTLLLIVGAVLLTVYAIAGVTIGACHLIARSKGNESVDTDDTDPVVTAAPSSRAFAALENASHLLSITPSLTSTLDDVIAREELHARELELSRRDHATDTDDDWISIGPVQAILLDPILAKLTGEARTDRLKLILQTTKPVPVVRQLAPVILALVASLGFLLLLRADVMPWQVALPAAGVSLATLMIPRHRTAYMPRPGRLVLPPHYPRITLDDAQHLATLTPNLWRTPARPARITQPVPAPAAPPTADPGRARRIAEVHDAVTELETEWLAYQLDTQAWFLTKPQLRNLNDPRIKAYRDAEATLRDLADDLTEHSTDTPIAAAQTAARRALKAWGTANQHALAIGVTNLSPSEEAALHTLHGLVGQLNDRATPKAMWPSLIAAITRTMDKLTTVPFALADIATLPVIEAESRLRAITQHTEPRQP